MSVCNLSVPTPETLLPQKSSTTPFKPDSINLRNCNNLPQGNTASSASSPVAKHRKLPEKRITLIKKRKISPTAIQELSNENSTATNEKTQQCESTKKTKPTTVASTGFLRNLIPVDWRNALNDANLLNTETMNSIEKRYYNETEIDQRKVHPQRSDIFKALELCPLSKVRVVIIGQDPYPRYGQAMGLAFSVPRSMNIPPSLKNIFKELSSEYNGDFAVPEHGDLSDWARQGVLLLNTSLTVCDGEPASHSQWGWHEFTDNLIRLVCKRHENIVFIMWGLHAQNRGAIIPTTKSEGGHYKLRARHPSPKSADGGFFGCGHFTQCNELLARHNIPPIEWGTRLDGSPLPRPQQTQVSITNFVRVTKSLTNANK